MSDPQQLHLSRRERQVMDVIYRRGQATALDVIEEIPDPPTYSAVRAILAVLEKKGHVKHKREGVKYIFAPTRSRERAAQSALTKVLQTFFDGSAEKVIAALLNPSEKKPSREDLERMTKLIEDAKKENR
jgi:BlaI family penicillinase repressor